MKKTITYICIAVIAVACNEDALLNQNPKDQATSAQFWKNEADAQTALIHPYSKLRIGDRWEHVEAGWTVENFRDDFTQPGADASNYPDWTDVSSLTVKSNNSQIWVYWASNYEGIYGSNLVMENVSKMTTAQISDDAKKKIIAQARFLRAYFHLRLIKVWDRIILRDKTPKDATTASTPLSDRVTVLTFLENEFKQAAIDLPTTWPNEDFARITKGAALGFWGTTLLYQKKYAEAATALKQVIDLGVYQLDTNFLSLFDGTNENNKEVILQVKFTNATLNGATFRYMSIGGLQATEIGGWESWIPTQKLLNEVKQEGKTSTVAGKYDARAYATLFFNDATVDVFGQTYASVFGAGSNKISFRKFLYSGGTNGAQFGLSSYIDQPILRYADILLMRAEALNETGDAAGALALINEVRDKHGKMPPLATNLSKAQTFAALVHERAMEFAMEGSRYYDLVRWGDAMLETEIKNSGKAGVSSFTAANKFILIPQNEVETNPNLGPLVNGR